MELLYLFYFLNKLVGFTNCLNHSERMFFVEAAAAWEARACLGHSLGAKSLIMAVQLPSASACWLSQRLAPWPPVPLTTLKLLVPESRNSIGRWGQMWIEWWSSTSTKTEQQPRALASADYEMLSFSPNSIFYFRDPEIVTLFSGLSLQLT